MAIMYLEFSLPYKLLFILKNMTKKQKNIHYFPLSVHNHVPHHTVLQLIIIETLGLTISET